MHYYFQTSILHCPRILPSYPPSKAAQCESGSLAAEPRGGMIVLIAPPSVVRVRLAARGPNRSECGLSGDCTVVVLVARTAVMSIFPFGEINVPKYG